MYVHGTVGHTWVATQCCVACLPEIAAALDWSWDSQHALTLRLLCAATGHQSRRHIGPQGPR